MAKIQTRKSISINVDVFDELQAYCAHEGISMSSFVQELICRVVGIYNPANDGRRLSKRVSKCVESTPSKPESEPEPEPVVTPQREQLDSIRFSMNARTTLTRKEIYQRRAISDPCRDEKCAIEKLHPRHDLSPDTELTKLR